MIASISNLCILLLGDLPNKQFIPFWPFIIILVIAGTVLYTRAMNANNWILLFRSTYSSRAVAQLIRETNVMDSSFSGLLVFTFFLSLALLLFNIQSYFHLGLFFSNSFVIYLLLLFVLFGTYTVKIFLLFILQGVFNLREIFDEYIVVFMNINIALGIWLIPLNLIFIYGVGMSKEVILWTSAAIVFLAFALRYVRIFEIGIRNKMKWYNIILYLCTLEIMPIILMVLTLSSLGIFQ